MQGANKHCLVKETPSVFMQGPRRSPSDVLWSQLPAALRQQRGETPTGRQLEKSSCSVYSCFLKFWKLDDEFCRTQASPTDLLHGPARGGLRLKASPAAFSNWRPVRVCLGPVRVSFGWRNCWRGHLAHPAPSRPVDQKSRGCLRSTELVV